MKPLRFSACDGEGSARAVGFLKHEGHKEPRRDHGASHLLARTPSDLENTLGPAMSQKPIFVVSLWIFVPVVFQTLSLRLPEPLLLRNAGVSGAIDVIPISDYESMDA